jgi:alkyl sulfatase BDS1-like metallo-beta-lactamase superfamily hydrolase
MRPRPVPLFCFFFALAGVARSQDLNVPVAIHPDLAAHTNLFAKKVYKIGNVYSAVGWGLANILMIEGTDGIVIVDTGQGLAQARAVLAEFRKITAKPIKAIIYTHHHADHVLGASAFASAEEVKSGQVEIIAHESLEREYADENGLTADIMTMRAGAMYNSFLALLRPQDAVGMNSGIGPILTFQSPGFLPPTRTITDHLDLTIAGVRLQLLYVPSEASSEICIWLPDSKSLLSAEVVQDHTFPNIYTLRGAKFRDPRLWVASIDTMRAWPAEAMIPQHGPPVEGRAEVASVLRNYRDAIQFVHDQTVRYANKGYAKDELMQVVKLPPQLAAVKPWLEEFYGSVQHSAPEIYAGYLGWFDGDPLAIDPVPRGEEAQKLVALMGGRDKVYQAARAAYNSGDWKFAAALCTYLIRIDANDMEARLVKAAVFRQLGYATVNANWRGLYLTAANVLEKKLDLERIVQARRAQRQSGDELQFPMIAHLQLLAIRLMAEQAATAAMTMELRLTDRKESYSLTLRNAILEFHSGAPARADVAVAGTEAEIAHWIDGVLPADDVLAKLQVTGNPEDARRFLGYFERKYERAPNFFLR